MKKVDQVKQHIKKHKTIYICVAVVVVTTIAAVVVTRKVMLAKFSPEVISKVSVAEGATIGDNAHITTNIYNGLRGHPGFQTLCLDTGEVFSSQNDAALFAGVDKKTMSRHLNGLLPDINGVVFTRLLA